MMDYYQILEDCLLAERIEPYTQSKTRKKLTRSQRYLFFDLGVRRIAAREGTRPAQSVMGSHFEHWVGLELIHLLRRTQPKATLHFWRDPAGPEVDWLIRQGETLLPIEVKWTDAPTSEDIKHLTLFLKEYPAARNGVVVCQTPRRLKITERIFAIPWQDLPSLIA